MKVIRLEYKARFGHFQRAESGTTGLSYPVPPRTTLLGLMGAILGLEKDQPQIELEPAYIAVAGGLPVTHWHTAKLRKDPPALLPYTIRKTLRTDRITAPEEATLIRQEWLFNPVYEVWISVPDKYLIQLNARIKDRKWHFQPSMGLSEMMADIDYIDTYEAEELPEDVYEIHSVVRQDCVNLDIKAVYEKGLAVQLIRMPRAVTPTREFTHAPYAVEKDGLPIPVHTNAAYRIGEKVVMFL